MKKQIIIAALTVGAFIFGVSGAQAQATVGTTTNINLSDVISIDPGSIANQGIVDFNYTTAADYNAAKNVTVDNSLIVTSSKIFSVKVKAMGQNFSFGQNHIPINVMKIKAVAGGTMTGVYNEITLSTANQTLVTDAAFGAQKSLSIDYSISAAKAQTVLLGKPMGTYKQRVTYTATVL